MPYLCGVCEIDTKRKRCLPCRSCDIWFHPDCVGVTKELFATLDKNRNLTYTCKECMENPPDDSDVSFKNEMRKEFAALKSSFQAHSTDMKNEQTQIKDKFESVFVEIRKELSSKFMEIKDEVANCKNLINSNDIATKKKLCDLELQNHALQHRLNRSDVVITGLAVDIVDLKTTLITLCTFLKVDIVPDNILNIMYIKQRGAILAKFDSISTRDKIMSAYFKTKSLKLSDVVGGNVVTRVYLNDNYSSLANKLLRLCWKLKKDKKINGYSIINRDILKAKITMLNNAVKIVTLQECVDLFNLDV